MHYLSIVEQLMFISEQKSIFPISIKAAAVNPVDNVVSVA